MKKVFAIFFGGSLLLAACGGNSGTPAKTDSASANGGSTTKAPDAAAEKGLELIGASDCTTCHRLEKSGEGASIGPAYSDVAAKYSPAADSTVDRLVKKIIAGGSGVWGTVPMTPHGSLPEADVREMVKYILTLKK